MSKDIDDGDDLTDEDDPTPPQHVGAKPGRKAGSKNKAGFLLKYAIQSKGPDLLNKLFKLTTHLDPLVKLGAIKILLAYGWGRPPMHIEVSGEVKKSYVMEMPPTMEHDEWIKLTREASGIEKTIGSNGRVGTS